MRFRQVSEFAITAALAVLVTAAPPVAAQGRLAGAKAIRCTFPRNATGSWTKDGAVDITLKPSTLVLRFDTIDFDESTAQLRTGQVGSEVVVRTAEGYVHFMQVFRTGPIYVTTVFARESEGKLKAVHSRHEYFAVPLPGATSSPEQYYGECEVVS